MKPLIVVTGPDGKEYNIGHFQSGVGSWILKRLMRTFREFVKTLQSDGSEDTTSKVQSEEDFATTLIQQLLMELSEEEYLTIQRHALNVVSVTDFAGNKPFEQPIILRNGTFTFKELVTDIATVDFLTSQSLFANLSPFFSKNGLNQAMTGQQASNQLSSQT